MTTGRPAESEYDPFYAGYLKLVPEPGVREALQALEAQPAILRQRAASVAPERETYRYAPGKWSIRQVFGHLTDAERVFGYRAFCIGRGDRTPLPGFDENDYVARAPYEEIALAELVELFSWLRTANLAVLRRLDEAQWRQVGTANEAAVSVRALAFIMAGHVRHHLGVLEARYGLGTAD